MGKHQKLWLKTRAKWLKDNPPSHEGYYTCAICGKMVHESEITIDHILSRSRRPDLRYEMSNLQPACGMCNYEKGSQDYTMEGDIHSCDCEFCGEGGS